jgi:protoheme IX farnesyltransferase
MINYYLLTKPGIVMGNLFTFMAGFLLASKGAFDAVLFCSTFTGIAWIMASACVFNNYIDREMDSKMQRTKNRALATGIISGKKALLFATLLGIAGSIILLYFTNLLATSVAWFGFFDYVVLYSLWKGKTIYSTAIGSVAGAVPPVVGYCAVSQNLDLGAVILFVMLVLWQMPHFFSIALNHFDDYVRAKIPVLPVIKGLRRTRIHMSLYIMAFIGSAILLTIFEYAGKFYLVSMLCFSLAWLAFSFAGFKKGQEQIWGRRMFQLSLAVIGVICVAIPLEFYFV